MAEGITCITVKGFKSIADECSIDIRPLTILAGANSSGKSSIMQPILMMKQTLEATYDPGPLLLDGPNVRFNSVDQFLSRSDGKNESQFNVGLEMESVKFRNDLEMKSSISFYVTFIKSHIGMDVAEISYRNDNDAIILRPEMTEKEMIVALAKTRLKKYKITEPNKLGFFLKTERNRFFLELRIIDKKNEAIFMGTAERLKFSNVILGLIHLPALRGNPERNYKKTSVGPMFPGTFEIYAASIIHHWQSTHDQRLHVLGTALELLGLTWKVGTKKVDDVSIEVMVGRLIYGEKKDSNDLVSIADVGFGISQTLPVIVALLTAEPGQLVYIEQPEIHLHPKAQMAMAQILADAANRGVRVVVETHSALLLLGIQSLVAEGKLSPDKVKLHWFKRRPEDGVTEVSSADLDRAGAFGDWPEDFSSAEMDADTRYIHAAEARLESN
jgi:AAA domain, putative AbiEii toxin, Type IV TA system